MSEIGVIITAEDKASAVLNRIGDIGKKSLDTVRKSAKKAGESFKTVGIASALFNQALELGKKALEVFRLAVVDTINVALNFRKIGDPAIESFKKMQRSAQIMRARIGDILIPLAQGLSDAFNATGNSVLDWINVNRKLIATNLADWMAQIANLAIKGVAFGVLQISRAWSGWLELIGLVKAAGNKLFSLFIKGWAVQLSAIGKVLNLIKNPLGEAILSTADKMRNLAGIFSESGDESIDQINRQIAAQDAFEQKLSKGTVRALKIVGDAHVAMLARIKKSTIGGIRTIEEQQTALDELISKADEASKKLEAERLEKAQLIAGVISESFNATFEELIDTEKTTTEKLKSVGKSLENIAISVVEKIVAAKIAAAIAEKAIDKPKNIGDITASAAVGGAKAAAASGFLGPASVAVGLATTAAIEGAFVPIAAAFAQGGIVKGGTPNKDSVLAMLTPNEEVLTQREARDRRQGQKQAQPMNITQNLVIRSDVPPTDTDYRKAIRRAAKEQHKLRRRGLLPALA